jgi:hypothetical protein
MCERARFDQLTRYPRNLGHSQSLRIVLDGAYTSRPSADAISAVSSEPR